MLTAAVLVGLLAYVSAHSNNMMGGNGMMNGNFGQGMYGNMGQMGQMGQNQMNNNNGMSQLMRLLGMGNGGQMNGHMGGQMNGYNGGQMNGHMGGQMNGQMNGRMGGNGGQQGMMGGMMLLLLQDLLQGNRGNQGNRMSEEEMEGVEEMMKKKMMMEMAEMMMVHMDYKEKQEEFAEAMEHLCFMVNATYMGYQRINESVWNQTTEASMMEMGAQLEGMTKHQTMDYAIDMMMKNEQKYSEVFLRFATWACMTGDAYVKAAMKMEKMEKGEKCGDH